MARNDAQDGSPWTQRGFLLAAGLVAIIVVLGTVVVLAGPGRQESTPPGGERRPDAAASQRDDTGECNMPAGNQKIPTEAPGDTRWELAGKVAVPTASETVGPGRVENGLRSCFSRTPLGALYATANVLAMAANPETQGQALKELVVRGEGRQAALTEFETQGPSNAAPGAVFQVAGFSITSYDPSLAMVDIAFRVDDGATQGYVSVPTTMKWEEGDWKLVIPSDGEAFTNAQPISDLRGYVRWSGA